jgi:hypothetical protein
LLCSVGVRLAAVAGQAEQLRVVPSVRATLTEWLDVIKGRPVVSLLSALSAWRLWVLSLDAAGLADTFVSKVDSQGCKRSVADFYGCSTTSDVPIG